MKGLFKCAVLIALFSISVLYVNSANLVDINVFVDLARLLTSIGNALTFRDYVQGGAPILATKALIGFNLTILLFPDKPRVTTTTQRSSSTTQSLSTPKPPTTTTIPITTTTPAFWKDTMAASECANVVQEHSFTPAMKMEELIEKRTVTNLNGNKVIFERNGDQVMANGRLITERDIALGDNIIAHRIAEPLETFSKTVSIIEAITYALQDLLGGRNPEDGGDLLASAYKSFQTVLNLVTNILSTLGINTADLTPLTFVAPDQTQGDVLTRTYSTSGMLLLTPLLKNYIKKYTFPGSYSPDDLLQLYEITNLLGEKLPITKLDDGNLLIGDTKVYLDAFTAATDGYVYNAYDKE